MAAKQKDKGEEREEHKKDDIKKVPNRPRQKCNWLSKKKKESYDEINSHLTGHANTHSVVARKIEILFVNKAI